MVDTFNCPMNSAKQTCAIKPRMVRMTETYVSSQQAIYVTVKSATDDVTITGVRIRAESHVDTTTGGDIRPLHLQAVCIAAKEATTLHAIYAETIAKQGSTVTNMRGAQIEAYPEVTATITSLHGIHLLVGCAASSSDYYGIWLETTSPDGGDETLDAFIHLGDRDRASGVLATSGIEFSSAGSITSLIYNNSPATYVIKFASTNAGGAALASVKTSGSTDLGANARFTIMIGSTAYYVPAFTTAV